MLTARVPCAFDDEIASVLGEKSLGVEVASSGAGMSELRIYAASIDQAQAWRDRAEGVLLAHGLKLSDARLSIVPVADDHWVERWQASLAPIPLGRRFLVCPNPDTPARDGREAIRLIPGMAFGTGEHETTRLAAAGVERHVTRGSRWLDCGTGTGILAIVAARCGASRVLAVDLDPDAAAVAVSVVHANAVDSVVEVRTGSLEEVRGESFDGIVANIQASFFLTNAAALATALVDSGILLASGFLEDDAGDVIAALEASGLRVKTCASEGAWRCVAARRGRA